MDNTAETALSPAEIRELRAIAGTMIPESPAFGVPGADDPAILADIVRSMGRDLAKIREAMAAIAAKSSGAFAGLDQDSREGLINDYYSQGGVAGVALGRVVMAAYYRDDRVLQALGMEARPPFPKGYALEQGDWSLLDAVRDRPPFWRDDRTAKAGKA